MATTFTPNYNLGMQKDHADKFDMDVITDNMEIIDTALSNKQDKTFTSYTTDSAESTITSSTTVQDAIEQLDYRTATNKANISSKQDKLSIVDTTVILGTDNTDISWIHSNSGIYYSNDISVSGISTVYAVSIKGFIALTQTDVIQPMISSDGTKIRFLSNVNTFDSHDTSLILRVVGIN